MMMQNNIKGAAGTERGEMRRWLPDISSFTLHVLAMIFMLCDHLWATVVSGNQWLTWVGRLTFPIYAFLIVEGYFHTRSFKKYLLRLLVFALLSEIPFNLMYGGYWIYPFHQNVLWTFLIALLCMKSVDKLLTMKPWLGLPLAAVTAGGFWLLALLLMVDYYGYGVLMVLVFYIFRGNRWFHRGGQLVGMILINWYMISGLNIPVEVFGTTFEIPQQGMAVLALLPIWCYRGRQGYHNKAIQYAMYAFYPLHILILGLLA